MRGLSRAVRAERTDGPSPRGSSPDSCRRSGQEPSRRKPTALASLARRCLAALAACCLLLGGRSALRGRRSARRAVRCLAAPARGSGRVRDPRGALLRHPLVLERLVLLLVLHVRALVRHSAPPS